MDEEAYEKTTETLGSLLALDPETGAACVARACHIAGERLQEEEGEDFLEFFEEIFERLSYWIDVAKKNPPE